MVSLEFAGITQEFLGVSHQTIYKFDERRLTFPQDRQEVSVFERRFG